MAEQYKLKRVKLPIRDQRMLMGRVLARISAKEAAEICNLSERTLRDWKRGIFSMDHGAIQKLCRKAGVAMPKNLELRERYWYTTKGAKLGWLTVKKKYGRVPVDPEYRKRKWREWWEREGRFQQHPIIGISKPIAKPRFSEELAEFAGVVLGDGGISNYQVTVTLHHRDDKEYGKFVKKLITRLFHVPIGECHVQKDSIIHYIVSRVDLVRFCVNKIGLHRGNKVKQQVDIPEWIKRDGRYLIACVRGLVDTDGCIFRHSYKVKDKMYSYKKLSFTSRSHPLRQSVFQALKDLGIQSRLDGQYNVRIDSKEAMKKYFAVVSSHNPKHLKRYKN